MKAYLSALVLFYMIMLGCGTEPVVTAWQEVATGPDRLVPGVPAFEDSIIDYQRNGQSLLTVSLDRPVVVGIASKSLGWGYFQFPTLYRRPDGVLIASWHMAADAIASYGKDGRQYALSNDDGKSWQPTRDPGVFGGFVLSNGDRIKVFTPEAQRADTLRLPAPIDSAKGGYGNTYTFYPIGELPDNLQGVYLQRLAKGSAKWEVEQDSLHDPEALRYAAQGLFPVVWWGDMRQAKNGSVVAGMYPGYRQADDGPVLPSGIFFYRSADQGHSWHIQGRISYQPDLKVDSLAREQSIGGFTEPAFDILSDGTYICVMRTTGGSGNRPMYISRSTDEGKTWSKPVPFTPNGVLPQLLQLDNGVMVLSSGRPGVQLRFCTDGQGKTWTDPFEMLPYKDRKQPVSCGYTGLLATGKNKFLLIYSDFNHRNTDNEVRKAIVVREITVTRDE